MRIGTDESVLAGANCGSRAWIGSSVPIFFGERRL